MTQKKINWKIFTLVNFLIIIYCSFFLIPGSDEIAPIVPHIDKIGHFILYGNQAIGLKMTLINMNHKNSGISSLMICFILGLLIEILQPILTYNRVFDLFDILANIVGAIMTISILKLIKNIK
tara:strand:- start:269 stop:637 length:369 start_codon:yes stop_codon:yes gene_type:complete